MPELQTVQRVSYAAGVVFSELDAVFQLDEEELLFRPPYQDAWTILEHLEHVMLANHFLLLTITKGCRVALRRAATMPVPEGESDLQPLAAIAVPGAFAWPPPLHMIPTGTRPAAEIREELKRQGEECLDLLERMRHGEGKLYSIRMSVNRLGRLDMYQWLYFLAQHAKFHLNLVEKRTRGGHPNEG